jgi:ArsR family transcriptional regulator, arsenate/arsenite/antimonite-responsive transcriptional repressor
MREFLKITAALSDASRVRLLLALRRRELCVCQLIELLGLAGSTVSKHLAILEAADLVRSRKDGRWVYYRLPDAPLPTLIREALDWVFKSLDRGAEAKGDRKQLDKILALDRREICQRQCRN